MRLGFANDSNDSYADQTFDLSAHIESSVACVLMADWPIKCCMMIVVRA
jgi:hypothetical protein